ncbi:MAG TPA: 2-oxo acid dehydrogenase subunit E2 [Porticoccaceae bacterium]|nr:2-oxo acid dehydrogenase subunit E2 [Porticoccaceae bacterium]
MRYFNLPDLGEGLQEAEIIEWNVSVNDQVEVDQLLVTVETAKAVVEIPSPQAGAVVSLFGKPGDIIHVGQPLVEFAGDDGESTTVVGQLNTSATEAGEDVFIIGAATSDRGRRAVKATPAVRALAKTLEVNLNAVRGTGRDGLVTREDIERQAGIEEKLGPATPLRGVRRFMAKSMAESGASVVPVTLTDDARLASWKKGEDTTIRLINAIAAGCRAEPILNSWFDAATRSYRVRPNIDVSIAVNTPDGLFAPILRDVGNRNRADLRKGLNRLKKDVRARTIPPTEMIGATIGLSNVGTIAGRYANPVIVPPTVAILAAGRIRDEVCAVDKKPEILPVMPLSLTFDHRLITGGEAANFLAEVIANLETD